MSRFLSDVRQLPLEPLPDAPVERWSPQLTRAAHRIRSKPLVEPLDTFVPRVSSVPRLLSGPFLDLADLPNIVGGMIVSHRQFQTTETVGQLGRGTCWACAGTAALEAAYARKGVNVNLSPHYLFHIAKAHENHRNNGGISSLLGFGGSADIIKILAQTPVPTAEHVPYIDQGPLRALANSIPNTQGGLAATGAGTREQNDWFEFDLRNIPLMGRWFAQYGVKTYGQKSNFTNADIKATLAAGYDVVVSCNDKINNGGHVLLIFGYNDFTQTFEIKNSQSAPGWGTMKYVKDPQFTILYNNMYYIKEVTPVEGHWPTMWIGRWESNHDGWYGTLVIRRHTDLLSNNLIPLANSRISLGTWYGRDDGSVRDVVGHFVDSGRGLHCTIGDQAFELYLHTSDPYRASGRTFWNGRPFGVVMSRGTAIGAGSGFDRSEAIGLWDMTHDGWRGTLRIGAQPSYVQATDAATRATWIDPAPIPQQVDAHINFGASNPNQAFQILVHTQEDAVYGGVTQWGGRDWPVEGRMSRNLYAIMRDGTLRYYRHVGRGRLAAEWEGPKAVGTDWARFKNVFGGGDGVIYAIEPNGDLLWYYHEGRNQGTPSWKGPHKVGTEWGALSRVFAGEGGVIYGIQSNGDLLWYRHLGRVDGTFSWQGPTKVGTGWNAFTALSAGPDGTIYGVQPGGDLLWYRHYGYDQGYPIWHGPLLVGTGWREYDRIWAAGNGYFYGRTRDNGGDLNLWRHHGFLVGDRNWTSSTRVGNGWSSGIRDVFLT